METRENEFFDSKQLSEYLNVSKRSVEKWRVQRLIPGAYQVGRVWRFRRTEIEKRLLSGKLLLDKTA
jgi:excisionase family DNA binding protein